MSLLVLMLGLGAVIFAAIGAERWLKARGVARALGLEVAAMRWQAAALAVEITRRHRAGEAFDAEFFRTWRLSAPLVFPSVGADLGLLSNSALDRIGFFHAQLAAARERLALAVADGGFLPTPYRALSGLVRAFNQVYPWVTPYLDAMTRTTPDMSDANALLEEFERSGAEPVAVAYLWFDSCVPPD